MFVRTVTLICGGKFPHIAVASTNLGRKWTRPCVDVASFDTTFLLDIPRIGCLRVKMVAWALQNLFDYQTCQIDFS